MKNIIEFPRSEDPNEPTLSFESSATPEQMISFCFGMVIQLQASVTALAMLISEGTEERARYFEARRAVLNGLYQEVEKRFPLRDTPSPGDQ